MNTYGHSFRITTFGESHGGAVGVVIDGCPPGYEISLQRVQDFLNRRRPGQSHLTSPRKESDEVECLSGLADGISLGTPITLMVRNQDAKPEHYADMKEVYRPSHADFTTDVKYGIKAASGGGRASARETIGRVAGAAVAEQILARLLPDFRTVAFVDSIKGVKARFPDIASLTRQDVEASPLRGPDEESCKAMEGEIIKARKKGDTVGGTLFCTIHGCPAGLGEPVFDKLQAELAKAMMSLPASRGFEIGMGFASTELYGSQHNDPFVNQEGRIRTATNRSGGIQGGISNGELIYFRVAFKPVSTIFQPQKTVTRAGEEVTFKPKTGRHDPCVLPRAVPMVEAMATLVIMDQYLRQEVRRRP